MASCTKHPHEHGEALCRRCGGSWCGACLVYAFGESKPPYCMSCAMVAGGVKSAAAFPAMSKRQMRAQTKAAKTQAKAEARAAMAAAAETPPSAPVAEPAPATDWTTPWWEEQAAEAAG